MDELLMKMPSVGHQRSRWFCFVLSTCYWALLRHHVFWTSCFTWMNCVWFRMTRLKGKLLVERHPSIHLLRYLNKPPRSKWPRRAQRRLLPRLLPQKRRWRPRGALLRKIGSLLQLDEVALFSSHDHSISLNVSMYYALLVHRCICESGNSTSLKFLQQVSGSTWRTCLFLNTL